MAFYWVRFWHSENIVFTLIGYYCAMNISRFLYEGCLDIGLRVCKKKGTTNYSILITTLLISTLLILLYLGKYETKQSLDYEYLGLYFMFFFMMMFISFYRNMDCLYAMIILIGMALTILIRHFYQIKFKDHWIL